MRRVALPPLGFPPIEWAALAGRIIRDDRGSTAIEFALIATAMCLILYGSIEFCRLLWTQSALAFAVQEAARCASVTPATCGTSSQIATYAANTLAPAYIPTTAFTSATATCGHQVTAALTYPFIAPGLFPSSPTLRAAACVP